MIFKIVCTNCSFVFNCQKITFTTFFYVTIVKLEQKETYKSEYRLYVFWLGDSTQSRGRKKGKHTKLSKGNKHFLSNWKEEATVET